MKIKIDHIARIEGHAGFVGKIIDGKIKEAKVEVQEGARLFEALLVDRRYDEVPTIVSRICGICPVAHNLTSIKALEEALDIKPTPETIMLRQLMMAGQIIHSHTFHLFFLVMSDFFKNKEARGINTKGTDDSKKILALRDFGNKIVQIIGGRSVHPITSIVGGFTKVASREVLKKLLEEQKIALQNALRLFEIIKNFSWPELDRHSQYVSLSSQNSYFTYDGRIKSSFDQSFEVSKFIKMIREKQIFKNPSKRSQIKNKNYMVGALARIKLNASKLNPLAKKQLETTKILEKNNSFYNNLSQAIEVAHLVEESKKIIEKLLEMNLANALCKTCTIKTGYGVAALEVPRGTLFHSYQINSQGEVINANIVTPTAQFLNNLEDDIGYWLSSQPVGTIEEEKAKIAMLVRAYDPCITCAVH